jgi:carbamoyl-phosphate synthase small subunit
MPPMQGKSSPLPHVGCVGAMKRDVEAGSTRSAALVKAVASPQLPNWISGGQAAGRIGISGVVTRALTRLVRREGPPARFRRHRASSTRGRWAGSRGMVTENGLCKEVNRDQLKHGAAARELGTEIPGRECRPHVVAWSGAKSNIFRAH